MGKKILSRRDFLRIIGQSSVALPVLAACGGFSTTSRLNGKADLGSSSGDDVPVTEVPLEEIKASSSNVLFIAIDDLNDWIGALGGYYGRVHTPNFDRLEKMGMTFHNAYCPIPWCAPSRAATLSGLSPLRTGYHGDLGDLRQVPALLNAESLPEYFRRKGYKTYGGGKVFHGAYEYGPTASRSWITEGQEVHGWDEHYKFIDEPRPSVRPGNGLNVRDTQFDWNPDYDPSEESMPDYQLTQWGAGILKQASQNPFFLAVGIYRPHLPWYAPKKYTDLYPLESIQLPAHLLDADLRDVPEFGREFATTTTDQADVEAADDASRTRWRQAVQAYLASISFADACLGRLLDALESGPHANNTTIVLWSDNGFQLGEKRAWRKFKLWEKSARVPLMIALPSRANAGTICRKPVSLMDIYPTLADVCFNEVPSQLDGNSLVPLLSNPRADWAYAAVTVYSQSNKGDNLHRSVRSENYRYIRYADGSEELYDHRNDPNELRNLMSPLNGEAEKGRVIANILMALLPA